MNGAPVASPQVLVVEDDPGILDLIQKVLEEEGCAVTLAHSLPASLAVLEEHLFHLILTDLFPQPRQSPLQSIQPLLVEAAPIPVGIMTAWPVPVETAT